MNGEPLPAVHGFPVRMVVPGLYGYVSATKWLVDLELTTFDAYDPYWVQRGWAEEAPIKTMARIDAPKPLVAAGCGTRGRRRRGLGAAPWHRRASRSASMVAPWARRAWPRSIRSIPGGSGPTTGPPRRGNHTLEVRATDADGVDPNGDPQRTLSERRQRMALRRRHGGLTRPIGHRTRAHAPDHLSHGSHHSSGAAHHQEINVIKHNRTRAIAGLFLAAAFAAACQLRRIQRPVVTARRSMARRFHGPPDAMASPDSMASAPAPR